MSNTISRRIVIAGIVFIVIDRFIKQVVVSAPSLFREGFGFLGSVNDGMAFGVWQGNGVVVSYLVLGIWLALLFVAVSRRRYQEWWFVLLGAGSNLFDRFVYGGVIDYVPFFGIAMVNLADIMIILGIGILLARLRCRATKIG